MPNTIEEQWENIRNTHNIFLIKEFLDNLNDSPLRDDVRSVYYTIKDEHLQEMKKNSSNFTYNDICKYLDLGIFTKRDLIDEQLMTEESHEKMKQDGNLYPKIIEIQRQSPNVQQSEDDSTDIYLFGIYGTGKTSLLMGLIGADGCGVSIDLCNEGGTYAAYLQECVIRGIFPERTFDNYVTSITGCIQRPIMRNKVVDSKINFIEMSGKEFEELADSKKVAFANIGTEVTKLLTNNNRKIFFF